MKKRHLFVFVLLISACSPFRENELYQFKKGGECDALGQCQPGLVCGHEGRCETIGEVGTQLPGQSCQTDEVCAFGLICDAQGLCGPDIPTRINDPCSRADGCAEGLTCNAEGRCKESGSEGTGLTGSNCDSSANCAFGYSCNENNICTDFPKWSGVDCPPDVQDVPPTIAFSFGNGDVKDGDFFAMPFPNDARSNNGFVDYSNFPGVESESDPGPTVATYANLLGSSPLGFSPNATITTRFSFSVDFPTLKFGGAEANFRFVDLTLGDSGYGLSPRSRFFATGGRDKFVCQNYLSIRPSEGTPLREGHTYGTIFFKGLKTTDGRDFETSEDLQPLLDSNPPSNPIYANAWAAYRPLRQWLRDENIPKEDVIGATVFTIGSPTANIDTLRDAVLAAPSLDISSVVNCNEEATTSPCDRSLLCNSDVVGEQLTIAMQVPSFLSGEYPYTGANSMFSYGSNGLPYALEARAQCAAVYLPEGDDETPKPLVLFLPDGSEGVSKFLESPLLQTLLNGGYGVMVPETPLNPFNPDEVEESGLTEDALPHDLRDPIRARNLHLQGTMSLFAIEKAVFESESIRAALNLGEQGLIVVAHGQGTDLALPFITHSDRSRALILGGGQGGIIDKYLTMTAPLNTSVQLPFMFADEELNGIHPGMSLIQSWLDVRDPMNYGALVRRSTDTVKPKHIFYVFGTEDDQVSRRAQNALITSMRLKLVGETLEELNAVANLPEDEEPLVNNVARQATQGVKQYYPQEGTSGHDVLLQSDAALEDIAGFIEALSTPDQAPTLSR